MCCYCLFLDIKLPVESVFLPSSPLREEGEGHIELNCMKNQPEALLNVTEQQSRFTCRESKLLRRHCHMLLLLFLNMYTDEFFPIKNTQKNKKQQRVRCNIFVKHKLGICDQVPNKKETVLYTFILYGCYMLNKNVCNC